MIKKYPVGRTSDGAKGLKMIKYLLIIILITLSSCAPKLEQKYKIVCYSGGQIVLEKSVDEFQYFGSNELQYRVGDKWYATTLECVRYRE